MNYKTIILLTSSALVLSGCAFINGIFNKDSNNEEQTQITNSITEDTNNVTDSSSDDSNQYQTFTTEANFASSFSAGYQFDVTAGSQERLKNVMDPEGAIISSISTSNVTIQDHIKTGGESNLELTVGTGSKSGAFTIDTKFPLVSVTFVLQTYSKYISYSSSYSKDVNPDIYINDEKVTSLTTSTEGENPIEECKVTFTSQTSKVKISNNAEKQRFFIKSITFEF